MLPCTIPWTLSVRVPSPCASGCTFPCRVTKHLCSVISVPLCGHVAVHTIPDLVDSCRRVFRFAVVGRFSCRSSVLLHTILPGHWQTDVRSSPMGGASRALGRRGRAGRVRVSVPRRAVTCESLSLTVNKATRYRTRLLSEFGVRLFARRWRSCVKYTVVLYRMVSNYRYTRYKDPICTVRRGVAASRSVSPSIGPRGHRTLTLGETVTARFDHDPPTAFDHGFARRSDERRGTRNAPRAAPAARGRAARPPNRTESSILISAGREIIIFRLQSPASGAPQRARTVELGSCTFHDATRRLENFANRRRCHFMDPACTQTARGIDPPRDRRRSTHKTRILLRTPSTINIIISHLPWRDTSL